MGSRTIRYEGSSNHSGKYIIEDVAIGDEKFRRLFYLNSQFVIQSEAKLKRNSKSNKDVVDLTHLTCRHHVYMSVAAATAIVAAAAPSIVVVGLGGGGLCSFLHKFVPKARITGVDVDADMLKVANDWFGLKQDDKLTALIMDGLKFIEDAAVKKKTNKFDAILFDVDNKDSSIGMSCPPNEFLELSVLDNIVKALNSSGKINYFLNQFHSKSK